VEVRLASLVGQAGVPSAQHVPQHAELPERVACVERAFLPQMHVEPAEERRGRVHEAAHLVPRQRVAPEPAVELGELVHPAAVAREVAEGLRVDRVVQSHRATDPLSVHGNRQH
jgi:hypothetical protein